MSETWFHRNTPELIAQSAGWTAQNEPNDIYILRTGHGKIACIGHQIASASTLMMDLCSRLNYTEKNNMN